MWNEFAIIRWIKKILPKSVKILLIRIVVFFQIIKSKLTKRKYDQYGNKTVFILLSTDYANLGDHAMSFVHKKLLHDCLPDYTIVEILVNNTIKWIYDNKNKLPKDSIITLKGGGNVGIEYFREELIRRKIIKHFCNNKIIMFPQTVYFPKSRFANKEYKKTCKIMNSNCNFYAFVRDSKSYEIVKKDWNNVFLCPDIVWYLGTIKNKKNSLNEDLAVVTMRNDVEGIYAKDEKTNICNLVRKYFSEVEFVDTVKDYAIKIENREIELEKIINLYLKAKLVVTDRLHGMILALLCGAKCIVLQTYNHKLVGQYDWIKNNKNVQIATYDSFEQVLNCMDYERFDFVENYIDQQSYKELIKVIIGENI